MYVCPDSFWKTFDKHCALWTWYVCKYWRLKFIVFGEAFHVNPLHFVTGVIVNTFWYSNLTYSTSAELCFALQYFFFKFVVFYFFYFFLFVVDFVIHWNETAMGLHVFPIPIPPSHLPLHPLPLGFPSAPVWALVSCIQPGLVICFTLDNIHVSMLFSWNIPPSPSPTEPKSLFYTSVSLFLFCIQGYRYHLSKFHVYVLVYCNGLYLSGLLHSV